MTDYGYRFRPYVSTTKVNNEIHFNQSGFNSRSNATSFALTNCVSALIEVRGVRIGKESFKRRNNLYSYLYYSNILDTKPLNFAICCYALEDKINKIESN
mgnify:CR=1 FL=1